MIQRVHWLAPPRGLKGEWVGDGRVTGWVIGGDGDARMFSWSGARDVVR